LYHRTLADVFSRHVEAGKKDHLKPLLFADLTDAELLGYGVPAEWLADVRKADEDTLLELADHLPGEAAEALLSLATGTAPQPALPVSSGKSPFDHPDAQRRFRVTAQHGRTGARPGIPLGEEDRLSPLRRLYPRP
jgi:hypothetical protein